MQEYMSMQEQGRYILMVLRDKYTRGGGLNNKYLIMNLHILTSFNFSIFYTSIMLVCDLKTNEIMIENLDKLLDTLLSATDIQELLSASDHNQDYTLNKNGLTIDIKNGENSKSITVTYDNSAKTRREEFVNFLNNIDDDVFVAICEDLGNLQEIQDLIDSDEHLEEGIAKFKEAAIDYLTNAKQNIEDLLDAFEEI